MSVKAHMHCKVTFIDETCVLLYWSRSSTFRINLHILREKTFNVEKSGIRYLTSIQLIPEADLNLK